MNTETEYRHKQSWVSFRELPGVRVIGLLLVCLALHSPAQTSPFITTQPLSQTISVRQTATFTVVAGGTQPLSYQWRKTGSGLAGQAASSLVLANAQTTDGGAYDVVVTNNYGSTTSQVATLTINLLANGDFEEGNAGFASGYLYSPGNIAPEGTYDVVANPHLSHPGGASFGDHTSGHGLMLALNGNPNSNVAAWTETVSVSPGNTYLFSGWITTWGTFGNGIDPSPPVIRIVVNGQPQGSDFQLGAWDGQWQSFHLCWSSELSSQASIVMYDMNTEAVGNDSALDDFQFTVVPPIPPTILTSPPSRTAEAGSAVGLRVHASGPLPLFCLWYLNCTNLLVCSTNWELDLTHAQFSQLKLTNLQLSQSGAYTVVISNAAGAVTSAPAMLNVIAAVERRPVPGVKVTGQTGSLCNVDYADSLSPAPNWTPLGSVSLTGTPQYCFDLTLPLPAQRFYRAWQTGTPGVRPSLDLHLVPAITLTGTIGHSVRLDYINQFGPTDAWVTLDTVPLTNTSQLYFDVSATGQPQRLYRLVQVP